MVADAKVFVVVPVFERLTHTRACIAQLKQQTYPNIEIVIVDGGSRDGSVDALRRDDGITLIADVGEQWWTGATWLGVEHALRHGSADDFVMLLNDDTDFDPDLVAVLVQQSLAHRAAVGAVIVDVRDPTRVLNAGVTIDWLPYRYRVNKTPVEFNSRVDTLEGRVAIVPIAMIRAIGNVNRVRLPHYAADFEFFCRARRAGYALGVTGRARVRARPEATGIVASNAPATMRTIWAELTSRRSMTNLRDQLTLVDLIAPPEVRRRAKARVIADSLSQFATRSPLLRHLGGARVVRFLRQLKTFVIRPYPFPASMARELGLDPVALVDTGILVRSSKVDWYDFRPGMTPRRLSDGAVKTLWIRTWNPMAKTTRKRSFAEAPDADD